MISSLFKKSTPINYVILTFLLVFCFCVYQFKQISSLNAASTVIENGLVLLLLIATLLVCTFIVKKNALTKDNDFSSFFMLLFLLFIPQFLNNFNLLLANFLILLAFRRIFSLQSLKDSKEKIFDAALFIFLASLFQFWSILFIVLVYISIFFHVSRDYRHWLLPFLAFCIVTILLVFYNLLINPLAISNYLASSEISLKLDYFVSIYQNIAFSIYVVISVFFLFSLLLSFSKQSLNAQASFKKIIASYFIGLFIFLLSNSKSNAVLVFTLFPLSLMATHFIEKEKNKPINEIVLITTLLLSVFMFFCQL